MNTLSEKKDLVLVVDDSPDSLGMINETLDQAGLTVLVALEGKQAINIANSVVPDIILMDAIMPGLDGFETCKLIKSDSTLSHIPIIFMTGLSDTESIIKGLEAGGVDYVQKPVNSQELIARMQVHLNNARITQSAHSALDTARQFLVTTNSEGSFKWATPQAHQLLAMAGFDHDWLLTQLQSAIRPFFSAHYNRDKNISLASETKQVEVQFVSQNQNGEMILRLIDMDKPDEAEILRERFELTSREAEVLKWIAKGKSNSDIAVILDISARTINTHLVQIFRKLNVENRTSAAILAHTSIEDRQSL